MTADISLIIPIYNAEKFLQPCLDSVAAQTVFSKMEVLLIDDGSKDNSPAICDAFAGQHKNVTVIHKENGGVSVARNTGIEKATGKYLAFADADDLLMPEMMEKLLEGAESTGAQMAFCAFEHPYPDKTVYIRYPFEENTLLDRAYICGQIADFMMYDESLNALWNKIILRDLVIQNGLTMTVGKKYAEDREFLLRCFAVAQGACYVPYVGYYYRYVDTGAIQKPRTDYGERLVQQFRDDLEKFKELGVDEARFVRVSAECFGGKICGALAFANNKLKGKKRKMVLKSIVFDQGVQSVLDAIWVDMQTTATRFNFLILQNVRRKKIGRIRLIFMAMKAKVWLYGLLKGRG